MEYAYEKLMTEHKLTLDELPKDAQVGIKSIGKIKGAINLAEKRGLRVKPAIYDQMQALDKWVVREILDHVENKNTNTAAPPKTAEDIIDDNIDAGTTAAPVATAPPDDTKATDGASVTSPVVKPEDEVKAGKIDEEFKKLIEAGKTTLTLDELKSGAKTAYDVIFDNYTTGGPNGVETTHYDLSEGEKEVFTLTKK